jgi:polyisoprenoid-binding protein YceI
MSTYNVDLVHSEIGFTVRHMMFAKVRGHFGKWSAVLGYDEADPTRSKIHVEVETASVDTRDAQRDGHLRSPDFFQSDKFPKMIFEGKRIERAGSGRYELTGDLTIRDTTREVTLEVEQTGSGKDPWGNQRLGFRVSGAINRGDWGLKWNQVLEAGSVMVSDKVDIEVEVQVIVAQAAKTSAA